MNENEGGLFTSWLFNAHSLSHADLSSLSEFSVQLFRVLRNFWRVDGNWWQEQTREPFRSRSVPLQSMKTLQLRSDHNNFAWNIESFSCSSSRVEEQIFCFGSHQLMAVMGSRSLCLFGFVGDNVSMCSVNASAVRFNSAWCLHYFQRRNSSKWIMRNVLETKLLENLLTNFICSSNRLRRCVWIY